MKDRYECIQVLIKIYSVKLSFVKLQGGRWYLNEYLLWSIREEKNLVDMKYSVSCLDAINLQ